MNKAIILIIGLVLVSGCDLYPYKEPCEYYIGNITKIGSDGYIHWEKFHNGEIREWGSFHKTANSISNELYVGCDLYYVPPHPTEDVIIGHNCGSTGLYKIC